MDLTILDYNLMFCDDKAVKINYGEKLFTFLFKTGSMLNLNEDNQQSFSLVLPSTLFIFG